MNKQILTIFITLSALALPLTTSAQTPPPATTQPATTPAPSTEGFELKDLSRGFTFIAPNIFWSVSASQYAVSLTHSTYYDAYVSIKKSWYNGNNVQEAYDKRKENLKSFLPGAEFLRDAEALNIGAVPALSMTYKDPAQQKITREVIFIHKGIPYELSFTVKEENFPKIKDDFAAILRGIQTI